MHEKLTAGALAGEELTLEWYGSGYALLRSDVKPVLRSERHRFSLLQQFAQRFAAATRPVDVRYRLTDQARRELATQRLFGQPWPSGAEAQSDEARP